MTVPVERSILARRFRPSRTRTRCTRSRSRHRRWERPTPGRASASGAACRSCPPRCATFVRRCGEVFGRLAGVVFQAGVALGQPAVRPPVGGAGDLVQRIAAGRPVAHVADEMGGRRATPSPAGSPHCWNPLGACHQSPWREHLADGWTCAPELEAGPTKTARPSHFGQRPVCRRDYVDAAESSATSVLAAVPSISDSSGGRRRLFRTSIRTQTTTTTSRNEAVMSTTPKVSSWAMYPL